MTDAIDLLITGATVVTDTAAFAAAVAVHDGRILAIGDARAMPPARERLDAGGLHLLPGAIDVHVHFREPGDTHKEDWETGTAAAACGGVTTAFEMPNTGPPTATPKSPREKFAAAGRCDPLAHPAARPAVEATEAVARAAILAEWTGARIHILHISSGDEPRPRREARARGSVVRVNPPVRERHHQAALWQGIADGTIDRIATDHAPHTPEEKLHHDIWRADCGFPGVGVGAPLGEGRAAAGNARVGPLRPAHPAHAGGGPAQPRPDHPAALRAGPAG